MALNQRHEAQLPAHPDAALQVFATPGVDAPKTAAALQLLVQIQVTIADDL